MKGLGQAVKNILRAKTIAISCHVHPDGDCIGSLLALGLGLESLGKSVYMLSPEGIPERYWGLPGVKRIENKFSRRADLAIAVDCNAKDMLGRTYKIFQMAGDTLEIDHHEFRQPFGSAGFIDSKAAAVGEMIFILLKRLHVKITQDIAQNILASIIVETNSFRLPSLRPLTFSACAELMKTGLDFHKLSELIYWSKTKEAVRILGVCLSRSRLLYKGKIIWSMALKKDLKQFSAREEDMDAVANELLSVKGVEAAVFFREHKSRLLRVSLRSKGKINVASIAEKYNGGGHFDAAGCLIPNHRNTREELLNLIKERVYAKS